MKPQSPTPSRQVRAAWPNAHSHQWAGPNGWIIYSGELVNLTLGQGNSVQAAWKDALKHVRRVGLTYRKKRL